MKIKQAYMTYGDKVEIIKKKPFIDSYIFNNDGTDYGIGYFEFDKKEIDKYAESLCENGYFASGHRIYKYENGKLCFAGLSPLSQKAIYKAMKDCFGKIYYYKNKYADLKDDIISNGKRKIFGFKRFRYCNNSMDYTLPFAFYEPENTENKKLPLVIYLHGYTNGGEKNITPFTECLPLTSKLRRNIRRAPCYIIVPSIPKRTGYITDTSKKRDYPFNGRNAFDGTFTALFEKLKRTYPIDESRVYIIGSSNGAMGTLCQLSLHSERYAAAIPMMGCTFTDSEDFYNAISNIPLWVCHAENDKVVPIKENANSDGKKTYGSDVFIQKLKNAGNANIRYTRYRKYGHRAFLIFQIKERWHGWLFSQVKK